MLWMGWDGWWVRFTLRWWFNWVSSGFWAFGFLNHNDNHISLRLGSFRYYKFHFISIFCSVCSPIYLYRSVCQSVSLPIHSTPSPTTPPPLLFPAPLFPPPFTSVRFSILDWNPRINALTVLYCIPNLHRYSPELHYGLCYGRWGKVRCGA